MRKIVFLIILSISFICIFATVQDSTYDWIAGTFQVGSEFGMHIAGAGDVNGDGYNDIIVGAGLYDNLGSDEGAVFAYYGSASGLSASVDWVVYSDKDSSGFGEEIACAGDVNGDGYDDVIIGGLYYDDTYTEQGVARLYYGSASGLEDTTVWTMYGSHDMAYFGKVACAGDVNGDGYSDVIVGEQLYTGTETREGRIYLFYGSASGLSMIPDWTYESGQANAFLGNSVAGAGDVNGDGYDDIIAGARAYDNGQTNEGIALLFLGGPSGPNSTYDWLGECNVGGAGYGVDVNTAGDVNGDGYSDVIVGAYIYNGDVALEGAIFLYLGSPTGLSAAYDWMDESTDLGSSWYGRTVSCAGDLNSDGYADVVVGIPQYDSNYGGFKVFWGGPEGLKTGREWLFTTTVISSYIGYEVSWAGDVNGDGISDLLIGVRSFQADGGADGAAMIFNGAAGDLSDLPDKQYQGNIASIYLGVSVAGFGDINGDGYADYGIGASRYDAGSYTDCGAVFIYLGSDTLKDSCDLDIFGPGDNALCGGYMASAGDVNGDGYSDIVIGESGFSTNQGRIVILYGSSVPDDNIDWSFASGQTYSYMNRGECAGDVNGDGYSDLIAACPQYDNGESSEGIVWVFYGSSTGLNSSPDWELDSDEADAQMGYSARGAGDVNGDGYDDVIIGVPYLDIGESNEGAAFLYYGSASGLGAVADWTGQMDQANSRYGISVAGAGDVNGDGYSDVIVGAGLYDNGESNEGVAFGYYGSASGLSATPDWIGEINDASANFGWTVSTAGDVNGDGYSDVVVGGYNYTNGNNWEGVGALFLGSSSGLSTIPEWTYESNVNGGYFGKALACAGDVNADGYSDVIVGGDAYTQGEANEGSAWFFYGNSQGRPMTLTQMRSDESVLVQAPLLCNFENRFKVGINLNTFMGIDDVKLQIEVKPLGDAFDGTGLYETDWMRTEAGGKDTTYHVMGLSPDTLYKWRARIMYDYIGSNMIQKYSRWYYIDDNGPNESDFRTTGYTMLNSVFLTAVCRKGEIALSWNELANGDMYNLYRKNGSQFTKLTTTAETNYSDCNPSDGNNEYKLVVMRNGKMIAEHNISVDYISGEAMLSTNIFYTPYFINQLINNEEITVYSKDGRALKEIKSAGEYIVEFGQGKYSKIIIID